MSRAVSRAAKERFFKLSDCVISAPGNESRSWLVKSADDVKTGGTVDPEEGGELSHLVKQPQSSTLHLNAAQYKCLHA